MIIIISTMTLQLRPEINNKEVTFKWLGLKNNYNLYIDDNSDFTSPLIQKVNRKPYKINLEPGIWYWKLDNNVPSKFTINSIVSVKRNKDSITNDGNVPIKIKSKLTGFVVLNPNESEEVGGYANVTAEHA